MLSIGPAADARPDGQGLEGLSDGDAATSLSTLKEWFRESEEALYSSRRASQRDRDYVDGKQWTSAESRALKQRGQSDAVYNRMRAKVDTIVGVEQQMRSDPRAYPRIILGVMLVLSVLLIARGALEPPTRLTGSDGNPILRASS